MDIRIYKGIFPVLIGFLTFLSSCMGEDSKCRQVDCGEGTCVDGKCLCPLGYEGPNCGTLFNKKLTGIYTCNETCTPTGVAGPYQIRIAPLLHSALRISIVGIWEVPATEIIAEIGADGRSFTIDRQNLMKDYQIEADAATVSASGFTITISYKIIGHTEGEILDECLATLLKKVEPAEF